MRFNKYIWDLYKESTEGKKNIKKWDSLSDVFSEKYSKECDLSEIELLQKNKLDKYIIDAKVNWNCLLRDSFLKSGITVDSAYNCYEKWIHDGIFLDNFEILNKDNYQIWTTEINTFSQILYSVFPDYFFPYMLDCEFLKFQKICNEFDIPIPEVPKKKDWEQRATYYIDLCEALLEFRKQFSFNPAELCAFLYDFAPQVLLELEDNELPNPSKVWFVGGNKDNFEFLDNAKPDDRDYWQGNLDAQRGNIVVMYCLTPRSYIHSIWRIFGNGFADPFFYYYSTVCITNQIKLDVHITQKDLEKNALWAKNPLLKKNLQGLNGYPIKYEEYIELLSLLKSKGQNIEKLPTIKPSSKIETEDLKDEREVEIKLIEPFLELLKYKTSDWIRQMSVKMGRGERNYPDYCFGANPTRGEETAKMILESKYEIKTKKDLQAAYFQAKSYALRLQAEKFVVAAKEGIWIFQPKNNNYRFEDYFHCNWIEIENPDTLFELRQMIGKK